MDLEQPDGIALAYRHNESVTFRPFARNDGGTQTFNSSEGDLDYDEKVPTRFGRSPGFTWRESFDLNGFRDIELWKHAILEAFATSMLVWVTSMISYAVSSHIALVLWITYKFCH